MNYIINVKITIIIIVKSLLMQLKISLFYWSFIILFCFRFEMKIKMKLCLSKMMAFLRSLTPFSANFRLAFHQRELTLDGFVEQWKEEQEESRTITNQTNWKKVESDKIEKRNGIDKSNEIANIMIECCNWR